MRVFLVALVVACGLCSPPAFSETIIFFSQNPNGGWAVGWHSNRLSKKEAYFGGLENCEENRGTNCVPVGDAFNNMCVGIAAGVGHNGYATRGSSNKDDAGRQALAACNGMGRPCRLAGVVCDSVRERQVICTKPVFAEEFKLKQSLDGSQEKTEKVAQAIKYLNDKYCRAMYDEYPESDQSEAVQGVEMCRQYSGMFRGERVYWGQCHE